jgi:hypothetical protein
MRSPHVLSGENDPIRTVEADILIRNGGEPSPTVVGKPLNDGKQVGIVWPMGLKGAVWEMSAWVILCYHCLNVEWHG